MKKLYIVLTIIFITTTTSSILSQSCLPEGITFTTQEQIDNFQTNYPGCSKILGNVRIEGGMTNLNGLNSVQVIGALKIADTQNLQNLDGLESLDSIGNSLIIGFWSRANDWPDPNESLSNIDGLSGLSYVGSSVLIWDNPLLENLDGLDNLTSIEGDLSIKRNDNLTSLNGLNNLTSIGGDLEIEGNSNLTECEIQSICAYLENPNEGASIYDNATGCNSVAEVENACNPVGINEINLFNKVSIFPNPNKGLINIDLGSLNNVSIKVLNVSGRLIYYKENINVPIYQFELDAAPGIYILELSAKGEKQQFKLVKN